MAALTQGAIEGLLGVLAQAITDEAQLIAGVPGDMQFIKDEMDSMNGFLLHLTNTEGQHDHQVRAWMKQVREIAYVAEDCVQRYICIHDMVPHEPACSGRLGALAAMAGLLLLHPKKYCQLSNLSKQITELKVRVRDVGERRMRYGVTVPASPVLKLATPAGQQEEKREAFVRALDLELEQHVVDVGSEAWWRAHHQTRLRSALSRATAVGGLLPAALPSAVLRYIPFSREIVRRLPPLVQSEAATVHGILKKCSQGDGVDDAAAFRCTKKMFLSALYAYPYATNRELEKLKEKLEGRAQDPKNEVMIFCYSMLTISQKSCLQYLTAFLHESEISRTSMVRRWVAEGLLGKEPGGGGGGGGERTPEEEGEFCFRELVFRGFIRPARLSDAGTVKSCVMDKPVRDFISRITRSENFVVSLPDHLDRQLKIRGIVQGLQPPQQERRRAADRWKNIIARCCSNLCSDSAWPEEDHPMDALVDFLEKLPELYRLNVLDLGGCKGLKKRHLKSFGDVVWLKYLSLRNTDVSHLPACHINKLTLLETLDIRGTRIRPRDTKKINLPKLKHLLAGRYPTPGEKASLITVRMPRKIGSMRCMETLSHVHVSKDGTELRGVAKLRELRKLGVVIHGNADSTVHLGRVLHALSGCLRSLSVCVATQGWAQLPLDEVSSTQEMMMGAAPRPSFILENLDIKGKISGLPSWITKAQKLANVTLRHTELSGEDALRRLANVLSLRCLKLSGDAFTEQQLVFKVVQFKALKILVLEGGRITTITFLAADAAPALEKIVWAIGSSSRVRHGEDLIVGINYLPNLKAIELRGDFKTTSLLTWVKESAESTSDPRYRIHYMSSTASDGNKLITVVPKTARDTTVSIPVAVINQH